MKKMDMQEQEKGQPKPIEDGKTSPKFWEYCPFCRLRRKIQSEIKKVFKERSKSDRKI